MQPFPLEELPGRRDDAFEGVVIERRHRGEGIDLLDEEDLALEDVADAAFLRHADGASHEEVQTYLQDVGRYAPDFAAKRLEFIEHPLWRTYIFVYAEGKALLERWVDAAPETERAARFGRLLHEQLIGVSGDRQA